MKARLVGFLAAILFATFTLAGVDVATSPAEASTCTLGLCGRIAHYSPDGGLDSHIRIRCDYGNPKTGHYLKEGQDSRRYCKDTDQVYNYAGQKIRCLYFPITGPTWHDTFVSRGWHKINDLFNKACVVAKR